MVSRTPGDQRFTALKTMSRPEVDFLVEMGRLLDKYAAAENEKRCARLEYDLLACVAERIKSREPMEWLSIRFMPEPVVEAS